MKSLFCFIKRFNDILAYKIMIFLINLIEWGGKILSEKDGESNINKGKRRWTISFITFI